MKSKLSTLGLVLITSALIFSGCGPTTAGVPDLAYIYCEKLGYILENGMCIFPDGGECEHWAFFRGECGPGPLAARDAVLSYVIEHYSEQAPAPGLTWTEERITSEGPARESSSTPPRTGWLRSPIGYWNADTPSETCWMLSKDTPSNATQSSIR